MTKPMQVTVQPTTFQSRPDGIPVPVRVQLQNTGASVDQFQVEVNDLSEEWYTAPPNALSLFPQERGMLEVQVHPPKGTAKAGSYPFAITVTSRAEPTATVQVPLAITVPKVSALEVDMSPRRVIGRSGRYRLLVRNLGNASAALEFEATDPEEECEYTFRPEDLEIEPGERATVQLRVKAGRSNLVGQRKQYDFQVKVKAGAEQPKLVQGQLVHTPRLGTWRPIRRLVTLVLLIALLGWAYLSVGSIGALRSRVRPWQNAGQKLLCSRLNVLCPTPTGTTGAGTKGIVGTPTAVPSATHTGALALPASHTSLLAASIRHGVRARPQDQTSAAGYGAGSIRVRHGTSIAEFAHSVDVPALLGSSGTCSGMCAPPLPA